MERELAKGWWRASDGYWYPPEARPGEPWTGEVRGPRGEQAPGPGWWLASDYQWYPPDARPGELWPDPVARFVAQADGRGAWAGPGGVTTPATASAGGAAPTPTRRSGPFGRLVGVLAVARRDEIVLAALGVALIALGVALLVTTRFYLPDAGTALRLLAWSPVAVGSSVTLIGAVRYLGLDVR